MVPPCALGEQEQQWGEKSRGARVWPSEPVSGWAGGTGETLPCPFLVPPGASPALTQSLGKGTELTPGLWQQAVSAKGIMVSHERGQGGPG